jgi:hypothetical protein
MVEINNKIPSRPPKLLTKPSTPSRIVAKPLARSVNCSVGIRSLYIPSAAAFTFF